MTVALKATPDDRAARHARLQRGMIAGVHALQQVLVAREPGRWPAFAGDAGAAERGQAVRRLIDGGGVRARAWVDGGDDAALAADLATIGAPPTDPALPVNAVTAALRARVSADRLADVAAIANLLQLNLQESEDGHLLARLFRFHHAFALALNLGQLGLRNGPADLRMLGEECQALSAPGPFPANDAAYWHLSFTRVEQWGDKESGIRDERVLARELAADPAIAALIPRLAALPARRTAFIGYSMMMSVNWSTHGAWNDIASHVVEAVNPGWTHGGFQRGGIRASEAVDALLPAALAWRPTRAYLLMAQRDDADDRAMAEMIARLTAQGCVPALIDEIRPWLQDEEADTIRRRRAVAARTGTPILPWLDLGLADPGHRTWECLDHIHMTTAGHLFYARAALRRWAAE